MGNVDIGKIWKRGEEVMWVCVAVPVGVVLVIVLSFVVQLNSKTEKARGTAGSAICGATKLDKFFIECVLAGYDDFSNPENEKKATEVAKKYNVKISKGVEGAFTKAYNLHIQWISPKYDEAKLAKEYVRKADKYDEKLKAFNNARPREIEENKKTTKYAEYEGREKRIIMIDDELKEMEPPEETFKKAANMYRAAANSNKDKDWAIWGGIADGLAGPAAGISMALDVQAENIERSQKRDEYNELARQMDRMAMMTKGNDGGIRKKKSELSRAYDLDVSKENAESVFKKLSISTVKKSVTKSGAIEVVATIKISSNNKLEINGKAATIDGTILAKAYEDERLLGEVKLVLPEFGVTSEGTFSSWKGSGYVLCGMEAVNDAQKIKIKYEPYKLWLMEL